MKFIFKKKNNCNSILGKKSKAVLSNLSHNLHTILLVSKDQIYLFVSRRPLPAHKAYQLISISAYQVLNFGSLASFTSLPAEWYIDSIMYKQVACIRIAYRSY